MTASQQVAKFSKNNLLIFELIAISVSKFQRRTILGLIIFTLLNLVSHHGILCRSSLEDALNSNNKIRY